MANGIRIPGDLRITRLAMAGAAVVDL